MPATHVVATVAGRPILSSASRSASRRCAPGREAGTCRRIARTIHSTCTLDRPELVTEEVLLHEATNAGLVALERVPRTVTAATPQSSGRGGHRSSPPSSSESRHTSGFRGEMFARITSATPTSTAVPSRAVSGTSSRERSIGTPDRPAPRAGRRPGHPRRGRFDRCRQPALGGDLGDVRHGELAGPFEDAVFSRAGVARRAGPTEHGWHVARVEAVTPESFVPFAEASAGHRNRIVDCRAGQRVRGVARRRAALAVIEPSSSTLPIRSTASRPQAPSRTPSDDAGRGDGWERQGGQAVVRDLVDHGFDVVNVDLQPPTVEVAPLLRAELTDLGETIEAIRGADAVVHLAAVPAPRIRTVERTFEINVLSTYNVFTAATLLRVQRVVWGVERDRPGLPFGRRHARNLLDPAGGARPSPRARLRSDRRRASAPPALELFVVQSPRRRDGAAVRAVDRHPVHRPSLLGDPRDRRVRHVPRRGAIRT